MSENKKTITNRAIYIFLEVFTTYFGLCGVLLALRQKAIIPGAIILLCCILIDLLNEKLYKGVFCHGKI